MLQTPYFNTFKTFEAFTLIGSTLISSNNKNEIIVG
jgi:hypothetical protein